MFNPIVTEPRPVVLMGVFDYELSEYLVGKPPKEGGAKFAFPSRGEGLKRTKYVLTLCIEDTYLSSEQYSYSTSPIPVLKYVFTFTPEPKEKLKVEEHKIIESISVADGILHSTVDDIAEMTRCVSLMQ